MRFGTTLNGGLIEKMIKVDQKSVDQFRILTPAHAILLDLSEGVTIHPLLFIYCLNHSNKKKFTQPACQTAQKSHIIRTTCDNIHQNNFSDKKEK